MVSLIELRKTLDESHAALSTHNAESNKKQDILKAAIDVAAREYTLATKSDLDIERIRRAEQVVAIRGLNSFGSGEDGSAVSDAIKWFAGTPLDSVYKDLHTSYFGTKNYDRWSHQRCDCTYGCGPSHGSICFAIELHKSFRGTILTESQREDCIYYLEALRQGKLKQEIKAA